MRVCLCVNEYACVCDYTCACEYLFGCESIGLCEYVSMRLYVSIYVCEYGCVCQYTREYVSMCVHTVWIFIAKSGEVNKVNTRCVINIKNYNTGTIQAKKV
jgi:hypothetical protein